MRDQQLAALFSDPLKLAGLGCGLSAAGLWGTIGADLFARAQALGPICGGRGLLDHCPLCWPAAALTAFSLASLLARPLPHLSAAGRGRLRR